jgi:tetratricopeptide (TPR) repeat protein
MKKKSFFQRLFGSSDPPPSETAEQLHHSARQLGQQGNYDGAIAKLERAIQLKPDWAYPYYDLAFTYLLKQDFEQALTYYKKTDALEPLGFFTAKTAIHTLEGEQSGKFPHGIYLAYLQLDWVNDPDEKLEMARSLTQSVPHFPPAWKTLATLLDDPVLEMEALETGLAHEPDPETRGVLLLNRANLIANGGDKTAAIQMVQSILQASESTRGTKAMAKAWLEYAAQNPAI